MPPQPSELVGMLANQLPEPSPLAEEIAKASMFRRLLRKYGGPHVTSMVERIPKTAQAALELFGPQADVLAMKESSSAVARALQDPNLSPIDKLRETLVGSAYTAAAIPMMALPGTITWHGTPHKWASEPGHPHGRPRLDKMGTGEGAQVRGKGHYSGQAKGTGEQYRRELADRAGVHTLPDNTKIPNWVAYKVQAGRSDEARKEILERIAEMERKVAAKEGQYWLDEGKITGLKKIVAGIDQMQAGAIPTRGHLYKYDIPDADTAKFLDYNAPLDAQPQIVKDALKKEGFWPEGDTSKLAGGDIFVRMDASGGAEEILKRHGVPGLRFKDQLSLGRSGGHLINVQKTDDGFRARVGVPGTTKFQGTVVTDSPLFKTEAAARDWADDAIKSPATYNYVTWDQDVLNRTKILEIDDVPVTRKRRP